MPSTPPQCPQRHSLVPDKRLLEGRSSVGRNDGIELPPHLLGFQHHTVIGYEGLKRLALMVTPEGGGSFRDQAWEAVSTLRAILLQQDEPMAVTMQTVFIDEIAHVPIARQVFEAYYGENMPLTLFVVQPPCDGRGLAIEAWAISTKTADVCFVGPHVITVAHNDMRWVYASAGALDLGHATAYEQSAQAFENLRSVLAGAGTSFKDVLRVWLYQGSITGLEGGTERYRELNRARTDFFARHLDNAKTRAAHNGHVVYPASTGIGTLGEGLMTTCMALQTDRADVDAISLENPLQTSAFSYPKVYSEKSPKFSRAMALRAGDHVTTWVSGTASIVDSETVHTGDVRKQAEQTLTNIEKLIAADNFARSGWADAGATLADLAKVRVYVKHAGDYAVCREVCEERLGRIPAIYAQADVCRPDLLIEIEGVAFSPLRK
jgi:enamine deaminase RidA (YjgF/YER057c/UK114 family)